MQSFETFYEKFSLNPMDWFRSPEVKRKLREQEIALRENDRRHARENIAKLKNVLKINGYTIHKSDAAYTIRKSRVVGLSKSDTRKNDNNPKFIRALFTLAHEVGHTLQWDENDRKINFDQFFDETVDLRLNNTNPEKLQTILHIQQLWYELDAWVKGMEFIPMELKARYKKYAYQSYQTYMDRLPRYYRTDIILRNLLHKLNFEEQ